MGAINYAMSDIYGGFAGTTETSIPEDADQQVLTDESKQTTTVESKKTIPLYLAIILIVILVVIIGGMK